MKNFAIVLGLLASVNTFAGVIYSSTADLSSHSYGHVIKDAEFKLIPTKTEIREIPGCTPGGEAGTICTEEVVLESQPVVAVNVSYVDPATVSEGQDKSWLSLNFKHEDFAAEDVATLKAAYPTWRHPFSRAGEKFAKKNLALQVRNAERTIMVVDVENSDLCPTNGETGESAPGCVERIEYKPAKAFVKEINVLKK